MTGRARLSLVAATLVASGCGAGEAPPVTRPASPLKTPAEPPLAPYTSPARWSFHPPTPASATATRALASGACLFTTSEGSRFLAERVTQADPPACTGKTQAASDVAEEPLVDVIERSATSWIFVGESGALYEAEGPLAPLRRVIPAPPHTSRVDGGGGVVLATTTGGELFTLEESSTWTRITPPGSRVFDVAVASDGHALALALPEALFVSDDGRAFRAAAAPGTIGARRVGRTKEGALAVSGMTGTIVWDPSKSSGLDKRAATLVSSAFALELEPSLPPTATSVVEGRAALDGAKYVEIVSGEDGADFALARGPLEGPLERTPLRGTSECTGVKLGARGRHVVLACTKSDESGDLVEILASADAGAHLGAPIRLFTDERELVSIAVSSEGDALVTGVCKTRSSAGTCSNPAPLLVRSEQGRSMTTLAVTPPLSGPLLCPAFSIDGRSAYFLGRRAKDERLALFVSRDAGATFTERALDPRASHIGRQPFEEGDEPPADTDETIEPTDLTSLRPGDDGTVGIVLMTGRGLAYFTTDEDGRLLGVAHAPIDSALLGGAGRHVLATAFLSGHERVLDDAAAAWESLDGGATWNEVATNPALARELLDGSLTMACATGGCLIGGTMARIGWNGQVEAHTPATPRPPEMRQIPAARTPLVCELDPHVGWSRIDDVDPIGPFGLPTLDQLARGHALWSLLSVDPATNAVTATAALAPERGEGAARVTTRSLLGPAPQGARVALDVSHQLEGYAAARVRLPKDSVPAGPMRDVEIAWENYFEGTSGRARIPDAGPFAAGDVKRDGGRDVFDTALVSVTSGAIFVRPHAPEGQDLRTFLLDPRAKPRTFTFPRWASLLAPGVPAVRSDAALAFGQPLAVATVAEEDAGPFTMILARQDEGGAWITSAASLAPGTSIDKTRISRNDWTYVGASTVGALALVSEPREGAATASFHAFRADGTFAPALAAPTPFDLSDPPRPCKIDDRRATPRVAARGFWQSQPMFPGRRHPVLIAEASSAEAPLLEPLALLTSGLVLFGSKSAPCVAAFEAGGLAPENGAGRVPFVAVIAGDPSQAFLFRLAAPASKSPQPAEGKKAPKARTGITIEHRPMRCHFDPSAAVPERLWSQPGMSVWAPP